MHNLHEHKLTNLLFEQSPTKNPINTEEPKKVPLVKVQGTLAPKIKDALNNKLQETMPSGWKKELSDKEKVKLLHPKGLGAIKSAANIDSLTRSIKLPGGLSLDSCNIGEPRVGTGSIDFTRFAKGQTMFFVIKDKIKDAMGGESGTGLVSIYLVAVPPLYTKITDENFKNHQQLFGIKGEKPKDAVAWYENIDNCLIIQLGTSDSLDQKEDFDNFLKTGNISKLVKIGQKQTQLRGTKTDLSGSQSKNESYVHNIDFKRFLFEDVTDDEVDQASQTMQSNFLDVHFASVEDTTNDDGFKEFNAWINTMPQDGVVNNNLVTTEYFPSYFTGPNNKIQDNALSVGPDHAVALINNKVIVSNGKQDADFDSLPNSIKKKFIVNLADAVKNADQLDRAGFIDSFNAIFNDKGITFEKVTNFNEANADSISASEIVDTINTGDVTLSADDNALICTPVKDGRKIDIVLTKDVIRTTDFHDEIDTDDISKNKVTNSADKVKIKQAIIKKLVSLNYTIKDDVSTLNSKAPVNGLAQEFSNVTPSRYNSLLLSSFVDSGSFLKTVKKLFGTKEESTKNITKQIEDHIEIEKEAIQVVARNLKVDLDKMFQPLLDINLDIDSSVFNNNLIVPINEKANNADALDSNAITARAKNVNSKRKSNDENHLRSLIKDEKLFGNDVVINFNDIAMANNTSLQNQENSLNIDNFVDFLFEEAYNTAGPLTNDGNASVDLEITRDQFKQIFLDSFNKWCGFSQTSGDSRIVDAYYRKSKGLLAESTLLNEGIAKFGLSLVGLYKGGGAAAVALGAVGVGGLTAVPLIIAGAFAGKFIGGMLGKKIDEVDESLTGINAFLTNLSKGFDGDFSTEIRRSEAQQRRKDSIKSRLSPIVLGILNTEILLTLRSYLKGIEEDVLRPLGITIEGLDSHANFGIDSPADFKRAIQVREEELAQKDLEENLSEDAEALVNELKLVPFKVTKSLGPAFSSSISSSSSKTLMKEVFKSSPVLKQVIKNIMEKNQMEETFVYKQGLSLLLENEGYLNRGKKKRKKNLVVDIEEVFDEVKKSVSKSLLRVTDFQSAIDKVKNEIVKNKRQSALSNLGRKDEESGLIKKDVLAKVITSQMGIPYSAFSKQMMLENKYASTSVLLEKKKSQKKNIEKLKVQGVITSEATIEDAITGSLFSYLYEEINIAQTARAKKVSRNYLNEELFHTSSLKNLLLEKAESEEISFKTASISDQRSFIKDYVKKEIYRKLSNSEMSDEARKGVAEYFADKASVNHLGSDKINIDKGLAFGEGEVINFYKFNGYANDVSEYIKSLEATDLRSEDGIQYLIGDNVRAGTKSMPEIYVSLKHSLSGKGISRFKDVFKSTTTDDAKGFIEYARNNFDSGDDQANIRASSQRVIDGYKDYYVEKSQSLAQNYMLSDDKDEFLSKLRLHDKEKIVSALKRKNFAYMKDGKNVTPGSSELNAASSKVEVSTMEDKLKMSGEQIRKIGRAVNKITGKSDGTTLNDNDVEKINKAATKVNTDAKSVKEKATSLSSEENADSTVKNKAADIAKKSDAIEKKTSILVDKTEKHLDPNDDYNIEIDDSDKLTDEELRDLLDKMSDDELSSEDFDDLGRGEDADYLSDEEFDRLGTEEREAFEAEERLEAERQAEEDAEYDQKLQDERELEQDKIEREEAEAEEAKAKAADDPEGNPDHMGFEGPPRSKAGDPEAAVKTKAAEPAELKAGELESPEADSDVANKIVSSKDQLLGTAYDSKTDTHYYKYLTDAKLKPGEDNVRYLKVTDEATVENSKFDIKVIKIEKPDLRSALENPDLPDDFKVRINTDGSIEIPEASVEDGIIKGVVEDLNGNEIEVRLGTLELFSKRMRPFGSSKVPGSTGDLDADTDNAAIDTVKTHVKGIGSIREQLAEELNAKVYIASDGTPKIVCNPKYQSFIDQNNIFSEDGQQGNFIKSGTISKESYDKALKDLSADDKSLFVHSGDNEEQAIKQAVVNYQASIAPKGYVVDPNSGVYYKITDLDIDPAGLKNGVLNYDPAQEGISLPETKYYLKATGEGLTDNLEQSASIDQIVMKMKTGDGSMSFEGFNPVQPNRIPDALKTWARIGSEENTGAIEGLLSQLKTASSDDFDESLMDDLQKDLNNLDQKSDFMSSEELADLEKARDMIDKIEAAQPDAGVDINTDATSFGDTFKLGDDMSLDDLKKAYSDSVKLGDDLAAAYEKLSKASSEYADALNISKSKLFGTDEAEKVVKKAAEKVEAAKDKVAETKAKVKAAERTADKVEAKVKAPEADKAAAKAAAVKPKAGDATKPDAGDAVKPETSDAVKPDAVDSGSALTPKEIAAVRQDTDDVLLTSRTPAVRVDLESEKVTSLDKSAQEISRLESDFDKALDDENYAEARRIASDIKKVSANVKSEFGSSMSDIDSEVEVEYIDSDDKSRIVIGDENAGSLYSKSPSLGIDATTLLKSIPYIMWGYRAFKEVGKARKDNYRVKDVINYFESDNSSFFTNTVATPIAYQIASMIESYPDHSALGLRVTGSLPKRSGGDKQIETTGLSSMFGKAAKLEANELIKSSRLLFKNRKVSESAANKMMEKQLHEQIENICVAMAINYDKDRTSKAEEDIAYNLEQYKSRSAQGATNTRENAGNFGEELGTMSGALGGGLLAASLATGPFGMVLLGLLGAAGASGIGGMGGRLAFESISNRKPKISPSQSKKRTLRNIVKNDAEIKADVKKIAALLKAQAKLIKGIKENKHVLHKNRLTKLLFERSVILESTQVTAAKIKSLLKSKGVSIYGFMDQSNERFDEAEADLAASILAIMKEYFDIDVENVDTTRARKVQADAAINTNVSKEAKAGELNNAAAAQNMAGMPMPHNLEQTVTHPAQIAQVMSYAGGNNMSEFMKLMITQQEGYMNLIDKIISEKMNFREASKELSSQDNTNFDNLDKSIEIALDTINAQKPFVGKDVVRKIYYTLTKSDIKTLLENDTAKLNFENEQEFISILRRHYNITKNKVTNIDKKYAEDLNKIIFGKFITKQRAKTDSDLFNKSSKRCLYIVVKILNVSDEVKEKLDFSEFDLKVLTESKRISSNKKKVLKRKSGRDFDLQKEWLRVWNI